MTKEEFDQWFALRNQVINGYHMSNQDKRDLLRLNHLVMEAAQKIHNDNMLQKDEEN